MGEKTEIAWCDSTYNLWRGCTKYAPGCEFCYAWRESLRFPNIRGIWGPSGTRIMAVPKTAQEPLIWNRKAEAEGRRWRVFAFSLADVFEKWDGPIHNHLGQIGYTSSPDPKQIEWYDPDVKFKYPPRLTMGDLRRMLFDMIDRTPWLDWLLLTKRPENVLAMWPAGYRSNVWLGCSISEQETMERNLPYMMDLEDLCPVRWLSAEPLLGPINFYMRSSVLDSALTAANIGWVVVGGESGKPSRPMDAEWARSIANHCRQVNVPFFFKQGSEANWPNFKDYDSFPADLRIRQFPEVRQVA